MCCRFLLHWINLNRTSQRLLKRLPTIRWYVCSWRILRKRSEFGTKMPSRVLLSILRLKHKDLMSCWLLLPLNWNIRCWQFDDSLHYRSLLSIRYNNTNWLLSWLLFKVSWCNSTVRLLCVSVRLFLQWSRRPICYCSSKFYIP